MNTFWRRTMALVWVGLLPLAISGMAVCQGGMIVDIYILAGQSNAEGHNHTSTFTPSRFPDSLRQQPNVMFWPGSNAKAGLQNTWTTLQVGASIVGNNAFGPEITFGHDMAAAQAAAQIAIVKYAVGGTGIARSKDYNDFIPALADWNDSGNNWHWPEQGQPTGNLYTNLLGNVRNALQGLKDQGKQYRLAGFLWMQGEHEGGISPSMANDYQMLLTGLISHLRTDLGQPHLRVVVGQISDEWTFHASVQTAQSNVCQNDAHAALVVTRDLRPPDGDRGHYTANGQVTLGSRFAASMQTLQVPRTGKRDDVGHGVTATKNSSASKSTSSTKPDTL